MTRRIDVEVKVGEDIIPHVFKFKYLGSKLQNNGEINEGVVIWYKWGD